MWGGKDKQRNIAKCHTDFGPVRGPDISDASNFLVLCKRARFEIRSNRRMIILIFPLIFHASLL